MRALAIAVAIALAAPAAATATTPGRKQYELGARAFHDKQWAVARRAFEAAYELDHEPELLYDVALATWRQADSDGNDNTNKATLTEARQAYRRYLDEGPQVKRRRQAEEALAAIETRLAAPATSATAPPPSATTKPDDREPDDRVPLDPYATPPEETPPPPLTPPARPPATVPPTETAPAPTAQSHVDLTAPPSKPAARRRWVAPVIVVGAVVVVAAVAIGLGVGLSSGSPQQQPAPPSLGTVSFP